MRGAKRLRRIFAAGYLGCGMTLAELNAAPPADFCAALRGVWEHSPWIVEAAAARRPFARRADLAAAMADIVERAGEERQLALLRAHPDLAGRLARAGGLTPESGREQASAGLDRLDDEEYATFSAWNAAYRERFGFPFIICVRDTTKAGIRAAFPARLNHPPATERRAALAEVFKIAGHRLADLVEE